MMRRFAAGLLLRAASIAFAGCMVGCVLAGCAVQGSPFERAASSPGHAVIYVYRPYTYGSSLLKPPVTCGEETARIGPGGYYAFVVPVGKTVCSVETETQDEVEINAEPRTYYIKEEFGWGVLTGHPHLDPMDTDVAQTEIHGCCVLEH
jgi:hypothetical protein